MLQEAVTILKEFQADKGAKVQFKKGGIVEKRPSVEEINIQEKPKFLTGTLPSSVSEEKMATIYEKMEEKNIYCDLEVPLALGGPFCNYGEIDNVLDQGKTVLAHKAGEVLLVDIWATWCPPCQKPMAHNQEMLEKNSQIWKDQVRIVGVSVDESKDVIKERIEAKKWHNIVHLTLLGWKGEHSLIKDFKIQGIPFVCLVDKFGKINYAGHPSTISLETRINELLAVEKEQAPGTSTASQAAAAEPSLSPEEIDKIFDSLKKEKLEEVLKDISLCCFSYTATESFENQRTSSKLEVKATILDGEPATLEKINSFFGQFKGIDLKITTAKYMDVPYQENPKCWKCESALNFPYYWLRWEEGNKFGCRTCVEAKSTQEGHHFAYEQNSILLVGKWDKIAVKNTGKNSQPADITKVTDTHGYCCNNCGGCSNQVGDARYICLGCRADPNFKGDYDDICIPCMEKVFQGDAEILQCLKADYHVPSHPFLRILYNTGGYYDF